MYECGCVGRVLERAVEDRFVAVVRALAVGSCGRNLMHACIVIK